MSEGLALTVADIDAERMRVGNGEKALVYLGPYLYRGVIRETDLLA